MTDHAHVHRWQPLGFHKSGGFTLVVQACECGDARELEARPVYKWHDEHPNHTVEQVVADA